MAQFLAKARASMERRGTVGSFGKATSKKIKAGLAKGGGMAKKAAFAEAMKTIARKRRGKKISKY
jgi:methyl coenzyme M reductase subunit C